MAKTDFKYNEDKILKEVFEYVSSTYNQHYVGEKGIQTIDVWHTLDMAESMCMGTLIKYAMRFGKKKGKNKADLLKLIHYAILTYHFAFMEKNNNDGTSSESNVDIDTE